MLRMVLKVVKGDGKPKPYRAKQRGGPELFECPHCHGSVWIKGKGAMQADKDGRPQGGRDVYICAQCLSDGKTVYY